MEKFLIKIFFWPWLHFWQKELWPNRFSVTERLLFLALLTLVFVFVRLRPLKNKLETSAGWPSPLRILTRLFILFVVIFLFGGVATYLPRWINNSNMPIAPHSVKEIEIYQSDKSSFRKQLVSDLPKTGFPKDQINEYLTDYIKIDVSNRLGMALFVEDGYICPGDILAAVGSILSWWTAWIISVWALQYSIRRLLCRYRSAKTQT